MEIANKAGLSSEEEDSLELLPAPYKCWVRCCTSSMRFVDIVDTSDFDTTDNEEVDRKVTKKKPSKCCRIVCYLLLCVFFALVVVWQWWVWYC